MENDLNNKFDVNIEQSILGAILQNKDLMLVATEHKIKSNMFYRDAHKEIYKAMIRLIDKGLGIDYVTLVEENKENVEQLGGMTYIVSLSDSVPSNVNFNQWLDILEKYYKKRCLLDMSKYINSNLNKNVEELTDDIQHQILKLFNDSKVENMVEQISNILDVQDKLQNGTLSGIKTGFFTLDNNIGGFSKGELITIVARSGVGKSTFAIQSALNMILANQNVIYLSNEMDCKEVIDKMASSYLDIELTKIRRGQLNDDELVKYVNFTSMLASKNNLSVVNESNINSFISKVKLQKLKSNVDIVFVDYINLILDGAKGDNMTQKLGDVVRKLKKLAMDENIAVVCLAQANRTVDKENKHKEIYEKVNNSDIQDSARIEQFSNVVISLHRNTLFDNAMAKQKLADNNLIDYSSKSADNNPDVINFTITKSRYGGQTTSRLKWDGKCSKISNFER